MSENWSSVNPSPEPEYISKGWHSPNSSIPTDIIEFNHSYGYDCKQLFNLCMITDDVLVFGSGNFIHYYHISSGKFEYRRSAGGGGIGFILKNPVPEYNYLTICENGTLPLIIIYEYPSHNVIAALKEGALRSYTCASYRPDGQLLVSQSGEPDYMITIWNWRQSTIILRCHSYQNEVLNVIFSPHNPLMLTSCGLGHIKFWKMAQTFTGLKLQGHLGRFGQTEISDIFAVHMLPDEKVISSCEWGNLLLWDAGLIKVEVCRKTRKPCHAGPITVIAMDGRELMTAATDGYIRIWFWETVELANPPEDDRFVEIEPIYEFRIGDEHRLCEIRHLIKTKTCNKDCCEYIVQDGNGGIWFCWLDKNNEPETPRLIYSSHGGQIRAADVSSISSHIATIGAEGRLHVYDYEEKTLKYCKQFDRAGTDIKWIPTVLDSSGCVLIVAFADGFVKQYVIEFDSEPNKIKAIHLTDVLRPHSQAITKLALNITRQLLVSGSEDKTIFIQRIIQRPNCYVKLEPIGFLTLTSIPTTFCWAENDANILIGSQTGEIFETFLADEPRHTEITYQLCNVVVKKMQFKSIKSEIRRNIRLKEKAKKKEEKRQKRLAELSELQEQNPDMEINEVTLEDCEEEEEEPPLYYPPKPNGILWLRYSPSNTVWISVAGYDSGYIYEMDFDEDKPKQCIMVHDADDTEIYFCLKIDRYSIFAMQGGILRINAIHNGNFLDLSDYFLLGVHQNKCSQVPLICTSCDGKILFTIGHDGNLFAFNWNGPVVEKPVAPRTNYINPMIKDDIDAIAYPSLEEQKIKVELDRKMQLENDRKARILHIAANYRLEFEQIYRRNQALPMAQQYTDFQLELDQRITEDLRRHLSDELNLLRQKLAFDVEKAIVGKRKVMDFFVSSLEYMPFEVQAIGCNFSVKCFRLKSLDSEIEEIKKEIERRLLLSGESISDLDILQSEERLDISAPDQMEESFFLGLNPENVIPKFPPKMQRLLNRYRQRKQHQMQRFLDWEKMNQRKPDPNKNHIDDIKAIAEAEISIGDYKLKTDTEYEPKSSDNILNKYRELLSAREKLHKNKSDFNEKLFGLRDRKMRLFDFIAEKCKRIESVQRYIPELERRHPPKVNAIDFEREYPEKCLIELVQPGSGIEVSDHFQVDTSTASSSTNPMDAASDIDANLTEKLCDKVISLNEDDAMPNQSAFDTIMSAVPTGLEIADILRLAATEKVTQWENEMKYQMIVDNIVEQDEIIMEIQCRIKEFDDCLREVGESKLQTEVNSKFLEIYLIMLNEELVVLKDCEQCENELASKALQAMTQRNAYRIQIDALVQCIDEIKKNNDKKNDQIKQIASSFVTHIKGNKFFDSLKRIFRKKYRPPKERSEGDASESESSSESSSDEDLDKKMSVVSLDTAPARLDTNTCPPGCDKKLYDLAFQLRAERHNLEQFIHAQTKLKYEKQKELTEVRKQSAKAETLFLQQRSSLTDFRRQKQAVLNTVLTLVVLHLDQLQYLKDKENVNNIPGTLLFGTQNVLQLYARVNELDLGTLETKRVHRINIIHLTRMSTDCKYMNRQIHLLQDHIQQAMYRKFGCQLDVDHLEEETLRRFVFQLQTTLNEERQNIIKQVGDKKKRLEEMEKILNTEIQIGAEKYNILVILQEEKNFLQQVLKNQARNMEKVETRTKPDFRHDLQKLKEIERHQRDQIENLEKEIRALRFKRKPLQMHLKEADESAAPDGTVEILPTDDLLNDDERLYKNIEAIMPMSHQFGPDVFTMDKLKRIVHTFMIRIFSKQIIPEDSMRKYIEKIAKFLGYVAKNFECDDMDKVMDCIVEQFQNIVPKKYLLHVKPQQIKDLFNEIVGVFRFEKIEIDVEEVIVGIVQNAYEMTQRSKPKPINFSQAFLVEIFKELIEVLTVGDLRRPQAVGKLSELLLTYPVFTLKCIDIHNLVCDVLEYARSSLLDEFTQHPVREFAESLYKKFQSSLKV